jgi:CP family cyanate transporter-like MFS transporter
MSRRGIAVLAALFLAALALRPQLVGVGPLLPEIQENLGLSHAVAGLLATILVLGLGVWALLAPPVAARLGAGWAVAAALAAIASFGLLRAVAPGAPAVLALTVPVGVGMGLAGALMPVAVKERFSTRPVFATGVYTTGINLGATISAATAVPIAHAAGGWRASVGAFSAATAVLLVAWLALLRPERVRPAPAARPRLPVGSFVAWVLVAVFAVEAFVYYGLVSWLPDAYVERGWPEAHAGALVAVLTAAAVPAGLIVPFMADRVGSRRGYLAGSAALLAVATLGAATAPAAGWLWALLAGIAIGVHFALTMTLPLDVADRPADVGAAAGLMLVAGYAAAALSPIALGALRDATGSFGPALWLLAAASALLVAVCLPLTADRLRRGVREPGSLEVPAHG